MANSKCLGLKNGCDLGTAWQSVILIIAISLNIFMRIVEAVWDYQTIVELSLFSSIFETTYIIIKSLLINDYKVLVEVAS
jgi:hypothetical protein